MNPIYRVLIMYAVAGILVVWYDLACAYLALDVYLPIDSLILICRSNLIVSENAKQLYSVNLRQSIEIQNEVIAQTVEPGHIAVINVVHLTIHWLVHWLVVLLTLFTLQVDTLLRMKTVEISRWQVIATTRLMVAQPTCIIHLNLFTVLEIYITCKGFSTTVRAFMLCCLGVVPSMSLQLEDVFVFFFAHIIIHLLLLRSHLTFEASGRSYVR